MLACVCDVYIPPSPPHPFSYTLLLLPSVPAGSKGGLSAAALQRSRSDVDVHAAAVAKRRSTGKARGAGQLPPGSYSSLGKGPVNQARFESGRANAVQYVISNQAEIEAVRALTPTQKW